MGNAILGTLPTDVNNAVGAMHSATVLISGFAARQQAAIDQALTNGATAEELQPLVDLQGALETETASLAAAVAANPGPA